MLLSSLQEYCDKNGDPFTSQLLWMGNPWFFFILGLNIIAFCVYFGPKWMRNRKPRDLKPVMIITNGLAFGGYTGGVTMAMFFTDYFMDCNRCDSYDPHSMDLKAVGVKYMGYAMIWTKVFDFAKPVLSILAKREDRVTGFQLINLQVALMIAWIGVKFNPGGVVILLAVVETFYSILVYGYLVFAAASTEMKPDPSFRKLLMAFRLITVAITMYHQTPYLLNDSCPRSYVVRQIIYCYGIVMLVFYPIDYWILSRRRHAQNLVNCKAEKIK